MALTDMKYTKAEKADEAKEMPSPMGSNMPDYPWGLCIDLDDESLKKLGITDLPEVGDEYQLTAIAKVTRISSSADEKEQENRLTLQITQMSLDDSDETAEPSETGVKSLLTNSMR